MSAVTAVVPVWNRRALLERLLAALRAQTCPPAEIVVVDNGSADGSAEAAEAAGARVLRMGSNLGFARAVNEGIRAARGPLVALINNDVEPAPDWLETLAAALEPPDAWFATGKILDARDRTRIDGTWDLLSRGACAWRAGHGSPDGPAWDTPRRIWCAPATAALFRAELFARIGGLDEDFESYLEDVDFGLRCARLGLGGVYVPAARAWHEGSATLGRWHPDTVRRIARNQVFLAARHYPARLLCRCAWALLVGQGLWGAVAARHGAAGAFLRGKCEGLGRFLAVRRRAQPFNIAPLLEESEREIRRNQRDAGWQWYWRLYFLLTAGGAI